MRRRSSGSRQVPGSVGAGAPDRVGARRREVTLRARPAIARARLAGLGPVARVVATRGGAGGVGCRQLRRRAGARAEGARRVASRVARRAVLAGARACLPVEAERARRGARSAGEPEARQEENGARRGALGGCSEHHRPAHDAVGSNSGAAGHPPHLLVSFRGDFVTPARIAGRHHRVGPRVATRRGIGSRDPRWGDDFSRRPSGRRRRGRP